MGRWGQYTAVQCSAVYCSAVQCRAVQGSAVFLSVKHVSVMFNAVECSIHFIMIKVYIGMQNRSIIIYIGYKYIS